MSLKKVFYRRMIAAVTALTMMFAASGCGETTSWIAKYDGNTVNAGIYIYYQTRAYSEATTILKEDNTELDTSDVKLLKTLKVEDKDITEWINDKAEENLRRYLAINKKFDELGLSLDAETQESVNSIAEQYWNYMEESLSSNGIGKESFKAIVELDYKKDLVFKHYYDEGGEKEYSEDEIRAYMEGNYARTKFIKIYLTDGDGTDYDDDAKKKAKEMAEDYKKRAIAGEDFEALMDEYDEYRTAETATEETEDTEDTAEEAIVTTVAETETTEETSSDVSDTTEVSETEVSDESEETETTAEETEGEETETTTEETEAEEAETTTEETEAEEAETTTVTESTEETATSETSVSAEEETEEGIESIELEDKDPYAKESIYKKGSEDDGYTPSKVVNDAMFNECVVDGDPVIVEDTEEKCLYVIQRLNILERTDRYEGDSKTNILWEILEDEFNAMALEWLPEDQIQRNEAAFRRYDPMNIKY